MNVRCVRCWRMFSDTRQQYACPHNPIEETMANEDKAPPQYDTRTETERLRDGKRVLGGEPLDSRLSDIGADVLQKELFNVKNDIAAEKGRMEVACNQIALAIGRINKLQERRHIIERDLDRNGVVSAPNVNGKYIE